jgi:hypothetical protein
MSSLLVQTAGGMPSSVAALCHPTTFLEQELGRFECKSPYCQGWPSPEG